MNNMNEPKKRGRPKGSKNKTRKTRKTRKKRNEATAAADEAFEEAFRNVPAIENIVMMTDSTVGGERRVNNDGDMNLEETERFGLD